VVDPRKKVPDLNNEVQDLLLEVVDLKLWDPVGSPPDLTPDYTGQPALAGTSS